jgi:hypothetical protein
VEATGRFHGVGLVHARDHDRRAVGSEHRERGECERTWTPLHVDLEAGQPGDRGRVGREDAVGAQPAGDGQRALLPRGHDGVSRTFVAAAGSSTRTLNPSAPSESSRTVTQSTGGGEAASRARASSKSRRV